MFNERRSEPREALAVPFLMPDGGHGTTRDLSESGVFFETDWDQEPGSVLDLEFTLASKGRCFRFVARGTVTRTEQRAEKLGVAMKFHSTRMEVFA
jgi:hypothetical protein